MSRGKLVKKPQVSYNGDCSLTVECTVVVRKTRVRLPPFTFSLNKKEEMAHITFKHEGKIISHIHVSWLSPLKIRKVLVGGAKKMVFYDDVEPTEKIKIYDKGIDINPASITPFTPLYRSGDIVIPKIDQTEPLKKVAEHFIDCIANQKKPLSDGEAGLRTIKIFEAIQESVDGAGKLIKINGDEVATSS